MRTLINNVEMIGGKDQAERETTAGDGSSVNVAPLSVCRDVASTRLLRTSLCRKDKEDGHLCFGNPV